MYEREFLISHEISQEIKSEYMRGGTPLAVSSAVRRLSSQRRIHIGTPLMPDFPSWDLGDLKALCRLTDQIPIYPNLVEPPRHLSEQREAVYRIHSPVFISRGAFYSPPFLKLCQS